MSNENTIKIISLKDETLKNLLNVMEVDRIFYRRKDFHLYSLSFLDGISLEIKKRRLEILCKEEE